MTPDTAELRRLAEAATPGPWFVFDPDNPEVSISADYDNHLRSPICFGHDYDDYGSMSGADAAYIAAVNPAVVLGLLDRIEALETALRNVTAVRHLSPLITGLPCACAVHEAARALLESRP